MAGARSFKYLTDNPPVKDTRAISQFHNGKRLVLPSLTVEMFSKTFFCDPCLFEVLSKIFIKEVV